MKRFLSFMILILISTMFLVCSEPNSMVSLTGINGTKIEFKSVTRYGNRNIEGLPTVKDIVEKGVKPAKTEFKSEKKYGITFFILKKGHVNFEALEKQGKSRNKFPEMNIVFYNASGKKVFTLTGKECSVRSISKLGLNDRMTISAMNIKLDF